jgi:hypothetical protein
VTDYTVGFNPGSAANAVVDKDALGNIVPGEKIYFGANDAAPSRVTSTTGLPVAPQKLAAGPTSSRKSNATASSGATGNGTSLGTGSGLWVVTADPDNAAVVSVGDSSVNAATGNVNGEPLQAGDSTTVSTADLSAWYLAVRTANDAVCLNKIG